MVHRNQKVTVELLSIGSLSRKGSHETAGEIMSLKKTQIAFDVSPECTRLARYSVI